VPANVTPAEYARARRLLMRRDPILGAAIKRIGPCGMAERQRNDHLTALVGAIVSQQLSTRPRRRFSAASGRSFPMASR
jgi:3-methyladenine DNA glycosylase/8-oxoguanine DNA glycosylase